MYLSLFGLCEQFTSCVVMIHLDVQHGHVSFHYFRFCNCNWLRKPWLSRFSKVHLIYELLCSTGDLFPFCGTSFHQVTLCPVVFFFSLQAEDELSRSGNYVESCCLHIGAITSFFYLLFFFAILFGCFFFNRTDHPQHGHFSIVIPFLFAMQAKRWKNFMECEFLNFERFRMKF